ncbi:MAG: FtsH protease activity modulator HflK [Gammaproteobacteria bacterium]|nr:MAG: FtsH protease activity modulator HflK [Gammaproteobacteria bacterium]
MAWNEPGGSGDNDPWGGRGRRQSPPDLDEVLRQLQERLRGLFGGGRGGDGERRPPGPGAGGGLLLVAALLAWLAYDSVYIIQPAERGVVLRFGRYVATLEPGPSIRLPRPIEHVERVNVDQIRTVEIGYRSEGRKSVPVLSEALMLTQDENIVNVRLAIQYKVKSPEDYLFHDRRPDVTLRQAAESAIREVVGKSKMDFVLKEGRAEVAARTMGLLQSILDRYQTGLQVTSVNLQDAQPPEQVQEAFLDAIRAREDRDRMINEAEAYANEIIPKARGQAARIVQDANAYKAQVVARAEGDASRFEQVLKVYEDAPRVTRQRMYLDAIQDVLAQASKVLVDVPGGSNLIYLPVDRLMQQEPPRQVQQLKLPELPKVRQPGKRTSTANAPQGGSRSRGLRGRGELR